MSYLKSMATSFVYVAFFLAVITFSPGLPPVAQFSEYSIKSPGELVGVLAPNERLNDPEILFNGEIKGPESFDSYNGELYTTLHGGSVGKIAGDKIIPIVKFGTKCAGIWEEDKCGRPLGLKFDKQGRLYVSDAYYGIFKVDVKTGKYEKLFDGSLPVDGKVPQLFNSLDVASNGDVYWTDSSTEFKLYDGMFTMLANPTGRLVRYNAATKKNEVLVRDLAFANGLSLSEDESYVLFAETLSSALTKFHLKGPNAGKREKILEGLPGLPDNIHRDAQGNYLLTLVVPADPQHPVLSQTLIPHPYVRKMLARLLGLAEMPFKLLNDVFPCEFANKMIHAIGSFESTTFLSTRKVTVLRIDGKGQIIDALHNNDEKIGGISSAFVHGNYLWLGSPFNKYLARVSLEKAFPGSEFTAKMKPQISRVEKPLAEAAKKEKVADKKPEVEKKAPQKLEAKPTEQKKVVSETIKKTEAPKELKNEKTKKTEAPEKSEKVKISETQKEEKVEKDKPVKREPVKREAPPKVKETAKPAEPARKQEKPRETSQELPQPVKQGSPKKIEKQASRDVPRANEGGATESKAKRQPNAQDGARQGKRAAKITDEV